MSLRLQRYSGQPLYSTSVQVYIQRIIGGIVNIKNNTTYLFSLAMEKTMSIRVWVYTSGHEWMNKKCELKAVGLVLRFVIFWLCLALFVTCWPLLDTVDPWCPVCPQVAPRLPWVALGWAHIGNIPIQMTQIGDGTKLLLLGLNKVNRSGSTTID